MCQNSPYINICGAISKREVKNMERSKAKADKFRFIDEEKREKVILSLKCIFSCAVGLLLARAKIFGSLSPLGLAFSAAAGSYALAASVGALVGYLLTFSGTAGIRYMACVAGIALINFPSAACAEKTAREKSRRLPRLSAARQPA